MRVRYAVVIEKAQNNYAAYVPDLDGCVATGKTIEEAERLIREAIELHLRAMKEIGEPVPALTSLVREVEVSCRLSG
jgi:predicted RNase H-like HicB family nuclease